MTAAAASRVRTDTAWWSLAANVLVWPGLGTLLLGRLFLGGAQLSLALLGFWLLLPDGELTQAWGGVLLVGALVWAAATSVGALHRPR